MDSKVLYRMCIDFQGLVYRLLYWMTSTGNTGISHTGAQPYLPDQLTDWPGDDNTLELLRTVG